jgi:hypothetical protein
LPIRSRTAAPRSSTSKQMRSPPFRSVVRSVIYILDYT